MNRLCLRGIELRYVLTLHLAQQGPATIAELIDALSHHGFSVQGRPSKAVSDALRWEIGRGRVNRLARGRYGPGYIPRSTDHRILQRVPAQRATVVAARRAHGLSLTGPGHEAAERVQGPRARQDEKTPTGPLVAGAAGATNIDERQCC